MGVRTGTWLLALTAALAGCTAAEPPASSRPPLPATSASAENNALPSLPPAARAGDAAGAVAFVRFYMEALSDALASGQATQLRSLTASSCNGCANFLSAIQQVAVADQSIERARLRVLFAEAPALDGGPVVVDLRYERDAGRIISGDGEVVSEIPAEPPLDAQVSLVRDSGNWRVAGFLARPTS